MLVAIFINFPTHIRFDELSVVNSGSTNAVVAERFCVYLQHSKTGR